VEQRFHLLVVAVEQDQDLVEVLVHLEDQVAVQVWMVVDQ
tara:strand:+ start:222 stop:341 length:120 start_codon:yes stop_codon:yes gene_type:complete